jgi:ERO1-like protein beta
MRTEGDYVDLSVVPEHYTGYSGEKAHRVWRAIYEENCFGLSEYDIISGRSSAGLPDTMNEHLGEGDEQCLEKRVYYKVISGMLPNHTTSGATSLNSLQVFMHLYQHIYVMVT